MLPGIDGRSAAARRYRDLTIAFAADLGGPDKLSEADKALIRQAAALMVRTEDLQGAIVRGDEVDDEQIVRLTNAVARALAAIRRKVRKHGANAPDLAAYLAAKAKADPEAVDAA